MTAENKRTHEHTNPAPFAIDLEASWQCRWWAEHFGVSRAELLAAILEVGVEADAVRQALARKARGTP